MVGFQASAGVLQLEDYRLSVLWLVQGLLLLVPSRGRTAEPH